MKENFEQDADNDREDEVSKNEYNESEAIKRATIRWAETFNAIPQEILIKLHASGDDVVEVTPPKEYEYDTFLPMWGWMWSFGNMIDERWLQDPKNLKAMADCGFRIYEQEDYGYVFGIDGMGYDFYEAHWIPLYKARGLRWHCFSS
ncbi:MAG: hypothetical protein LBC86_00815, partial [Oscillospiraceae bacterium]|nr:hypothetical protein [Oscillospiraceae bacterium]